MMKNRYILYKGKLIRNIRDIYNKVRYGANAPQYGELIYIDPNDIKFYGSSSRNDSGWVKSGNWDKQENLSLFEDNVKYRACVLRWREGCTWEETGIYSHILELIKKSGGRADNCLNMEDIIKRYNRLDKLYNEIKLTQRLKTRKELNSNNYLEVQGVFISIGRENEPIFWGGGFHRLAIAKILKLNEIPAQIGLVHPEAIAKWKVYKK